ncbi:hypothetical protein [Kosakonia cowanii]|uniref:hypothetical protein n=1 Tax=Kosakonia cowanii TaxID=208223 RepID=UPI003EEFDC35
MSKKVEKSNRYFRQSACCAPVNWQSVDFSASTYSENEYIQTLSRYIQRLYGQDRLPGLWQQQAQNE